MLVATAYFAVAQLGLLVAQSHRGIWPAAGVALAALLLGGTRLWPAVAVGTALAALSEGVSPVVSIGVGLGNALAAVCAAAALRRIPGFEPGLPRLTDVTLVAVVGSAIAATIAATVAASTFRLFAGASPAGALERGWTWWVEDVLGVLVCAPLILSWSSRAAAVALTRRRRLELVLALAIAAAATWLMVVTDFERPGILVLPILLCAVRHGLRGATLASTVTIAVLTGATWCGIGPLAGADVAATTAAFQVLILITVPAGLLVGAAIGERELGARALREAVESQQAMFAACPLAIVALDAEGRCTVWNPAAERIFGWRAAEVIGGPLPYVPPEYAAEFAELRGKHVRGEPAQGLETVRHRKDGSPLPIRLSFAPLREAHGRVVGTLGVLEDITAVHRAGARPEGARGARRLSAGRERAGVGANAVSPDRYMGSAASTVAGASARAPSALGASIPSGRQERILAARCAPVG
ncbi:MAG TPA: MASE1 domain-containing protein, partial [Gemmatimonadales bacterium]|nr:MASE1 domain-containing protein [Gemmatimonadales bacterium]